MTGSTLAEAMEHVAELFEIIGALILLAGLVVATVLALRSLIRSRDAANAYRVLRQAFGGAILLGLEVLVAADLVRTVAVAPTLENVVTLGVIVLIRTVLSFSLEIEIEGVAPWRRAATSGAVHVARAARRSGASS
ncbi:MAG TPA: DUF1622 domain-containing protein [Microlunatus sp.]|nr:DUF1622 domain-containing protein [Microlunatus sp.]